MNLIKWTPFERLFPWDNFLSSWDDEVRPSTWKPTTDILEKKDEFVFKFEVPGIKKEDIKIEIKDNVLTISGERKAEKELKEDDYYRKESYAGTFTRSFHLPDDTEENKIKANLKDGVLELHVPKSEKKQPKQIPVTIN